ncbi:MAG: hypothetical protein RR068_10500, partial [Hafnia sp.]
HDHITPTSAALSENIVVLAEKRRNQHVPLADTKKAPAQIPHAAQGDGRYQQDKQSMINWN